MSTIKRDDLQKQVDDLKTLLNTTREKAGENFQSEKITESQYSDINQALNKLENERNRLQSTLLSTQFNSLTLEPGSPGNKLIQATNQLEAAANQLDETRKFIEGVDNVINSVASIVTTVAKVAANGGFPIL